jgi:hypothetical protein
MPLAFVMPTQEASRRLAIQAGSYREMSSVGGHFSQTEQFKNIHEGFIVFIKASFFSLRQPLISFSLEIASLMYLNSSK